MKEEDTGASLSTKLRYWRQRLIESIRLRVSQEVKLSLVSMGKRDLLIAVSLLLLAGVNCVLSTPVVYEKEVESSESAGRESVPFDYGWRFRFGHAPDGAPGPGNTEFTDISNQECTNMDHNPNRFTRDDCWIACSYNPDCMVWQQSGSGCLHGGADAVCTSSKHGKQYGGQRKSAPPVKTDYQFAGKSFDASSWKVVDTPHDFVVTGDFVEMPDNHHGFLPRNVSWYRKSFHVPSDWKGSHIMVYFEGVFHVAQIWLNGQYLQMHTCGYTGFTVRLDNVTGLEYGNESTNVLAVRTDATFGSGHWYEGGGIYRRTHLIRANPIHFTHDGVFIPPEINMTSKTLDVSAEVESFSSTAVSVVVYFTISDPSGTAQNISANASITLQPGKSQIAKLAVSASSIQLWSIQEPHLYEVFVTVKDSDGTVLDAHSVSAGFRQTRWSGASGFSMNGNAFKFRGFSHHNSFTGVGVAIPDRIHLFRAQASRAVGGSFWRMSHNPYLPALYDFLDVLGVITWDENRDYALEYVGAMHEMVKRDRGHPSIVVWSYCNEYECGQITKQTGLSFRAAAKALDPQRPTAANGGTNGIDVQGMSHASNSSFINFHKGNPDMPLVLSECCSCETQRLNRGETTTCMHDQNSPGLLPYVSGSLGVWTLFDYYGESHSWPSVTSSFGNFDLAGFPKPHAYWYVLNWMAMIDAKDYGRPPLPPAPVTRILDLPGQITSEVEVLTSGTAVELVVNGKAGDKVEVDMPGEPVKVQVPTPSRQNCSFPRDLSNVQCHGLTHMPKAENEDECKQACCDAGSSCVIWQYLTPHDCWVGQAALSSCTPSEDPWVGGGDVITIKNLTAVSLDSSGKAIGSHTILGAETASAIKLELDVPSQTTGTGAALVLDGHDAALVRAGVVDSSGALVTEPAVNVSFRVVSGPGWLVGVGNGDNDCHQNAKSDHVPSYGGVARGIFQVNLDCVSQYRDRIVQIDVDHGPTTVQAAACSNVDSIIIEASSSGLQSAQLNIPVSASADDLPLAVAKKSVMLESYPYLTDFVG